MTRLLALYAFPVPSQENLAAKNLLRIRGTDCGIGQQPANIHEPYLNPSVAFSVAVWRSAIVRTTSSLTKSTTSFAHQTLHAPLESSRCPRIDPTFTYKYTLFIHVFLQKKSYHLIYQFPTILTIWVSPLNCVLQRQLMTLQMGGPFERPPKYTRSNVFMYGAGLTGYKSGKSITRVGKNYLKSRKTD